MQYDILGRGPGGESSCKMDSHNPWDLQFPALACKHVHGIRSSYSYRYHAEASCIGRVGIRPYHHTAWQGVILQHNLMDDAFSRAPEINPVPSGHVMEEGVDFRIGAFGCREVLTYSFVRYD